MRMAVVYDKSVQSFGSATASLWFSGVRNFGLTSLYVGFGVLVLGTWSSGLGLALCIQRRSMYDLMFDPLGGRCAEMYLS